MSAVRRPYEYQVVSIVCKSAHTAAISSVERCSRDAQARDTFLAHARLAGHFRTLTSSLANVHSRVRTQNRSAHAIQRKLALVFLSYFLCKREERTVGLTDKSIIVRYARGQARSPFFLSDDDDNGDQGARCLASTTRGHPEAQASHSYSR